jgi:hypothetical protein
VPAEFIYGIAYSTQSYGSLPMGAAGPYNSLNVGLLDTRDYSGQPTVGTDVDTDAVFWNTLTAAWYSDGHTITAVNPSAGSFLGAVVKNAATGAPITVLDLSVTTLGLLGCEGAWSPASTTGSEGSCSMGWAARSPVILLHQADGVKMLKNTLFGNEIDICPLPVPKPKGKPTA